MPDSSLPTYRGALVARGYDLLNALLWLPTGSDHLRRRFVRALELSQGAQVLELGCGTGLVTRHLCVAGAEVTAVDNAPDMLDRARRRAPAASFIVSDLSAVLPSLPRRYDRIVLAFVLHELDHERRVEVLAQATEHLSADGRIGILEWSLPPSPPAARIWRAVVRTIEPPIAREILDGGVERALADTGLVAIDDQRYASGRARVLLVARPSNM